MINIKNEKFKKKNKIKIISMINNKYLPQGRIILHNFILLEIFTKFILNFFLKFNFAIKIPIFDINSCSFLYLLTFNVTLLNLLLINLFYYLADIKNKSINFNSSSYFHV